jgi:ectoine hydroxylase-related dioxygenase (phytanoyl-CoA dioxygenase family)
MLLRIKTDIFDIFSNITKKEITEQIIFYLFKTDFEAYVNCAKMCHNLLSIHKLEIDDRMINIVKILGIESPAIAMRPVLFMSSRHIAKNTFYWKAAPHQDYYAMRTSKDSIIIWVPICEITKELGYLEVMPKSHSAGLLEHIKDDHVFRIKETIPDDHFVSVPMNLGDALAFSSLLIHRSGTNITDQIRWAINFRYCNLKEELFIGDKYQQCYEYVPNMQKQTV